MNTRTERTKGPEHRSANAGLGHKWAGTAPLFTDMRPEAAVQRKLQDAAHNSPQVKKLETVQKMADAHSRGTDNPVVQLQKANGAYRAPKGTNVRNDDEKHTVLATLDADRSVYVINKGQRVSNFRAGILKNEHSWVQVEDEYAAINGWIEDSKLKSDKLLQNQFGEGDKLYGRYEARNAIRQSGHAPNRRIAGMDYNIIDDVNQEMGRTAKGAGSEEVESFRDYTEKNTKRPHAHHQDLINQYCKQALVHYTNSDHTIHFMLDGIAPELVLRETKAKREHEDFEYDDESLGSPRVTSIELRALMRAAMRAKGLKGPKADTDGHDINLQNVKFYLNNVEVDAPWAAKVDSLWGRAWREYVRDKGV